LNRIPARALAFSTLLALLAPALTSPAAAQIVIHDVSGEVQFRDLTFKLPGPGWQRIVNPDQRSTALRFGRGDALHALELQVGSVEGATTLSNRELIEAYTQAVKKDVDDLHGREFQNGTRTIAGASYTAYSWRVVPDTGPVSDFTELVWIPSDFGARGRYFWAALIDGHSPSMSAAPLDDLDALVASFQTQDIGEVMFVDKPDDPDAPKLATLSADFGQSGYVDGEYAIQTTQDGPSSYQVSPTAPGVHAHAVTSADIRVLSGDDTSQTVSLGCRWSGTNDTQSGYRVAIEPLQGRFSLQRVDNRKVTLLVDWRDSDAIHRGVDGNHVELLCAGSTIGVAINGTPLASVRDRTYAEGRAELAASSQRGPMEARFANLTISAR
jgi:hypothetical protein